MGASGWHYFVPYRPEILLALQELREEIFKKGEYGAEYTHFIAPLSDIESGEMAKQFPHIPVENIEEFKKKLQAIQKTWPSANQRKPKTIAALLEQSGEAGTHSIIDIQGISETPGFGNISPLPSAYLTQFFGTEKPTREMAEGKVNEIQNLCERWQGYYLIVFHNDAPHEILFAGVSGD